MKKIFALLVSLLFLGSVVGIASVTANGVCHCDGTDFIFIPSEVTKGELFTIKVRSTCSYLISVEGGGNWRDYIVQVGPTGSEGDMWVYQVKALEYGTLKFCHTDGTCSNSCETLKITPSRTLPMQQFMKILGLGKKD